MKLILILLISIPLFANELMIYSSVNIDKIVNKLAKPFDLEKTIRTIIKIESDDGKYLMNLQDPSCGLTHININTYTRRHNIKNTSFNRNKACMDLINSPLLAVANAIEELLYWKEYHCKNICTKEQYKNVIKSYNAGKNYKSKQAQQYWDKFFNAYNKLYRNKQ